MKVFRLLSLLGLLTVLAGCKGPAGAPTLQPTLYNISEKTGETLPVTDRSTEVEALIAPYKAQLDAKMNRELAVVKTPLLKASPEGSLGNWMADIMAEAAHDRFPGTEIAFAVTNPGGLRVQEISAGPLLVSEIYELMPAHMTNSGGWPVSEALNVDLTSGKLEVTINGKPLDPDARYQVASIDYVANGGSGAAMLRDKPRRDSEMYLRDVLIEYAEKTPEISVAVEGKRMRL